MRCSVKHDNNKERWDLLPWAEVEEVVKVLTFGASKYGPDNWKKLPRARPRYFAALMRHIVAWQKGEKVDKESGLSHLAHAMCCIIFLAHLESNGQELEAGYQVTK